MPRRPLSVRPTPAAAPGFVFGVDFDGVTHTPNPEDVVVLGMTGARETLGPNALGHSMDAQYLDGNIFQADPNAATIDDVRLKGFLWDSEVTYINAFLPFNAAGYRLWLGSGHSVQATNPRILIRSAINQGGGPSSDIYDITIPVAANSWAHAEGSVYDRTAWTTAYASSSVVIPSPVDAGANSGYTMYLWNTGGNFAAWSHFRMEQI